MPTNSTTQDQSRAITTNNLQRPDIQKASESVMVVDESCKRPMTESRRSQVES